MREYGQIQCAFWSDPDMQAMSGDARLLACYLLTGPHSNGLGCYRLPDGYVQADLGWDSERVSKGFTELFQIGFAERCETTFFVLIPKFLRWNPVANANVAKARIKDFECVTKKASIYSRLCEAMLAYGSHWGNPFETVLKGYGKQEPTRTNPRTEPEPDPIGEGEPGTVSQAKRKRQLPDDFDLTEERRFVLHAEIPTANPQSEFEQFCDHHRSRGNTMLDWDAAWRTWCRNAKRFSRGPTNGRATESPLDRIQRAYSEERG